jgi:hypothetical protein
VIRKALVAASLALLISTSYASAQCVDCAMYPERDPLNNGAQTPASKMGLIGPGGAARANAANNASGARAQYMQQPAAPAAARAKKRNTPPQ